ncbi:MAG TPA: VOC family protein [Blastocatellia bacterium]|nr:VOC family protein [Blastocatellia bacterium]HMV87094.1 VOC family protein [Blastocatellia bacterium]HMX27187.1 VOC family protein [Blastocatellia bacterium]HMY76060.1 VOC family protein [Blastocatellia bacterium]HMZ20672.1 VOC family protein [Blastocatellia bacterium]
MNKIFSYVAIPADDFERAFKFYSEITNGLIHRNPNVPFPMAYFTDREDKDVGHLFQLPNFKPSAEGVIVYLELATDLSVTLSAIERAGGKVIMPKTFIAPGKGYWALFLDTEGNKLALHSSE